MAKIKIEHIVFWIIIVMIITIIIWKLFGSPTDLATYISLLTLVAASEIIMWKSIYSLDKKTSIGFIKAKYDINNLKTEMNNKLNEINKKLINIESLIKRKK